MAKAQDTDKNIAIWKIKKLIKALEAARGNGTSMISLIMPPRYQVSRVTKILGDEYGTASNIKSSVNRQSVLGAITSAQQRLKLYNEAPPNGLVLYTGTIVTEDGKEKEFTIDFEPFRPINASFLYLCDNKFHTEALNELLESDNKVGFIIMDANGTLFENLHEFLHRRVCQNLHDKLSDEEIHEDFEKQSISYPELAQEGAETCTGNAAQAA